MAKRMGRLKVNWQSVRNSAAFRNVLVFMVFMIVAALFWFIMALNDSVTQTFNVRVNLENVPDSVTFINDPPVSIHVTMRDKGTNLMRSGVVKNPVIDVNFRDYSNNGIFRMSRTDVTATLKSSFGNGIQILSTSVDSVRCYYTESPGKRVPVVIRADVTPSSGNIIVGNPVAMQRGVRIYSYGHETDSVNQVYTELLTKRDLDKTSIFEIPLKKIPGVRIKPDFIGVQINVEPLVHKEGYVVIEARGVPSGESLLLFPNRVPVSYYVPMSMFNDTDVPITVYVEYTSTTSTRGNKLPLSLGAVPENIINPVVMADSVEYTLVRK